MWLSTHQEQLDVNCVNHGQHLLSHTSMSLLDVVLEASTGTFTKWKETSLVVLKNALKIVCRNLNSVKNIDEEFD